MDKDAIKTQLDEDDILSLLSSEESIGSCRRIANEVYQSLQSLDCNVELKQGYFDGKDGLAEHFYVIVGEEYIVDPTVKQFMYQNWIEGKSDTYITIEPKVGIIHKDDILFENYV